MIQTYQMSHRKLGDPADKCAHNGAWHLLRPGHISLRHGVSFNAFTAPSPRSTHQHILDLVICSIINQDIFCREVDIRFNCLYDVERLSSGIQEYFIVISLSSLILLIIIYVSVVIDINIAIT